MLKIYEEEKTINGVVFTCFGLKDEYGCVVVEARPFKIATFEKGVFIFAEKKEDDRYINAWIYNEKGGIIKHSIECYPFNEDGLAIACSRNYADKEKFNYVYFYKNGTYLSETVNHIEKLTISTNHLLLAICNLGNSALKYINDKDFYEFSLQEKNKIYIKNSFKRYLLSLDYSKMTENQAKEFIENTLDSFHKMSKEKIEKYKINNEIDKNKNIKNFIEDLIK